MNSTTNEKAYEIEGEKQGNIAIAVVFILGIIIASGLLTGCQNVSGTEIKLTEQEKGQVTALLGDLNEKTHTEVRNILNILVKKAEKLRVERENKGNFEMSDKEYKLWEDITALLDEETIRQFGKDTFEEEQADTKLDYGKKTMENLKSALSNEDWKKLNSLRNGYFKAIEAEDEKYDVDIEKEIRSITEKYKGLDSDALVLNLLDEKNQNNLGMFTINENQEAIFQDGRKNGLKSLSKEGQAELGDIWETTTDILPKDFFSNFKYFKVGGDGKWGTYAYVIQVDKTGKYWCMTVDPADVTEDGLFPYTAVHEMMHYITLNDKQVEYFQDDGAFYPANIYSDWQCVAKENSYLQGFYQLFWKDIINDWATDTENPYFYYRHQSEFVTGYSATECAEDLAEAFSAYVLLDIESSLASGNQELGEKPMNVGTVITSKIQKKFDFFDGFPELKDMKARIRENIKKNGVYVNPEIEPLYEPENSL